MSDPSFIPERDPNDLYGPMGGNAQPTGKPIGIALKSGFVPFGQDGPQPPKDYKPGPETPHEVHYDETATFTAKDVKALEARRPHPPRILVISIATEPTGGYQLATQLKFSDISSPTQAQAILDVIEELNNRLSAALDYSPI